METKFTEGKWHFAYHPQEKFYSIHSMPSHPQDCGLNVLDENHVGKEVAFVNAKLASSTSLMFKTLVDAWYVYKNIEFKRVVEIALGVVLSDSELMEIYNELNPI